MKRTGKIAPCAKINLGLNVVSKREDGYHNLETVFYPVRIFDEITIEEADGETGKCSLVIEGREIEGAPEKNLVVRAYNSVAQKYPLPGVKITLNKQIPMQAGMGGGSADCAFTIRLLNEMFGLGMSVEEMQRMAAALGADCAFFITSEPSYAEGIGEALTPVDLNLSDYKMVIVKPPVAISTKEAFAHVSPARPKKNCREIVSQAIETWRDELHNDFEDSIFPQHPELAEIKEKLYDLGAVYAAMSGSGSALFGIFKDKPALGAAFDGFFTAII